MKFYKALKLNLCYNTLYSTTRYSVEQR